MSPSDAQRKAAAKYQKENIKRVVLKLNKRTDADILVWLDGIDNKQGMIKGIIRKHINNPSD